MCTQRNPNCEAEHGISDPVIQVAPTISTKGNSEEVPKSPHNMTYKVNHNPNSILKEFRSKNRGSITIGHLNINSIRNKFDALECMIKDNFDFFVVSETKLDESFPLGQFEIDGFTPHPPPPLRVDRNREGGGLIIYIRSDIPCKTLKTQLPTNMEGIFIELNIRNKKWLMFCGYNPKKSLYQTI